MSSHPRTAARSGAYTALLLTLSVLLSLLIPATAAQADTGAAPAAAAAAPADEDCSVLPLSAFGEAAPAEGAVTVPADGTACLTITAEAPGLHKVVLIDSAANTYAHVFDATRRSTATPPSGAPAGANCPVREPSRSG